MGKILVTGGAGFIGSHTCVELLENGYDIVVADNLSNSKGKSIDRIKEITGRDFEFYKVDILDSEGTSYIFERNKIDAVIHFAGLKAVGESVEKPLEYYHNNVNGTIELMKVMRKYGCNVMVFSSSATVYGVDNKAPYTEDMKISAINPYGQTKVMIENILMDVCKADLEFKAVALRYFNPIGAHESGLIGEDPNGIPNNLVPYIAQVAIGRLEHLNIYGNDYNTPDGTGVRDYIHVVDLAKGHIAALKYAFEHSGFEAINLGTGRGSSVIEVADAYEKACGREIKRKFAARRAGDLDISYANVEKAKILLDWVAESDIEKMCKDSWNFTVKNPNGL